MWARDINTKASKAYAYSHTPPENEPYLYEIIKCRQQYPVYLYFDIDWHTTSDTPSPDVIFDQVTTAIHAFLGINPVLGIHYQANSATDQTAKISFHLKYNYIFENSRDILDLVRQIDNPYIDKNVYDNFRCYRTLYSSKMGSYNPLIPYRTSSTNQLDHLVVVGSATPPQTMIPHINFTPSPQPPPQRHIPRIPNTTSSSSTTFQDIEQSIIAANLIESPIPIFFSNNTCLSPHVYAFNIDPRCHHICPIANESHHNLSNIRSSFLYNHKKKTIKYVCFNEACQFRKIVYTTDDIKSPLIWSTTYNSPTMQDYPQLEPNEILAVKANMGTGKTKTLVDQFITQYITPDTRCLFITYQRILTNKYMQMLQPHGFQNYMHKDFEAGKLVICLDSLIHITNPTYDYVFVDEVLSVLLHFNSNLMKNNQHVCNVFQEIIRTSQRVIVLDAQVDNPIVVNTLAHFEQDKQVTWIQNTYIKPSNRKASITFNTSEKQSKNMSTEVKEKVIKLLNANKKVVVASNSRSFTEALAEVIPSQFKHIVYNGLTPDAIINEHSHDPHHWWTQYDLIIYSPSISAGVSFELPYFDELVAYFRNDPFCPGVDNALQQLYRVRNLTSGLMSIYVECPKEFYPTEYPITEETIQEYLDSHVNKINENFSSPVKADQERKAFVYDKKCISYPILVGILLNKNKSLVNFVDILYTTLKTNYEIPTKLHLYDCQDQEHIVKVIELFEKYKKTTKNIPWSSSLIEGELDQIKNNQEQTPEDHMKIWIHKVATDVWGIEVSSIDEEFYDKFINIKNHHHAFTEFAKVKRYTEFIYTDNDVERYKYKMARVLDKMTKNTNYNIRMFKDKTTNYYNKIIMGMELLNAICPTDYKETLLDCNQVSGHLSDFVTKTQKYIQSMPDDTYKKLVNTFGMTESFNDKTKEWTSTRCSHFVKTVSKEAFGMEYKVTDRGNTKDGYMITKSLLSHDIVSIIEKYCPTLLVPLSKTTTLKGYAFLPDPQEDEEDGDLLD